MRKPTRASAAIGGIALHRRDLLQWSMHVVAFRHVPFEHLGMIAPALESAGVSFQYADLYRDPDVGLALDEASGLIFMGGPMSANDDLPYLQRELEIVAAAAERQVPMLGVCLGSQLIAKALGARVYKNAVKEIGWAPVEWTAEASRDALCGGRGSSDVVFHWHGETFDLPPNAVWLASSRDCRHQAFRVGPNTYGLQFHLEVTPEMIRDWLGQEANCGDVSGLKSPIDPDSHAGEMKEMSRTVFGRWARLVRGARSASGT